MVANIPRCEIIKLTKPTNTFHLSRKIGEGELSVHLKYEDGDIIKGKAIYYSDQGNIIYEGEFKGGIENGYGEKIYPNKRVYKGKFINWKIDAKYDLQKKLELNNN